MRNFGVTDYENVSGIDDIGMSRLAQRYAQAVTQRKAADLRREQEVELTPYLPQLEAARRKLARALEAESENIGGHLPVSSVYDALQVVKAQRTANIGIRALTSHLETLWKANRQASLSANSFTTLREHYTRNYPRAGMAEVFDAIAKTGYLALPMSDLVKMASEIRTQQDFELAMMKHGLDGRQPHQVKARKFVLAVLNGEGGVQGRPPFLGKQAQEGLDNFTRQYLETALWSSNDESDDSGGDPIDSNFGIYDIDDLTKKEAQEVCTDFQSKAEKIFADLDPEGVYGSASDDDVAHNFWLTRNGHGAGFWDGDYGDELGDALTKLAKEYGDANMSIEWHDENGDTAADENGHPIPNEDGTINYEGTVYIDDSWIFNRGRKGSKRIDKTSRKQAQEDFKLSDKWRDISISHATMIDTDIVEAIESELQGVVPPDNYLWGAIEEFWGAEEDSEDRVMILNEDIWDRMDRIAPAGTYFGAHPGDGSDFGFWSAEDEEGLDEEL